jgi:polyisoprenyl-phosphate glycosyltransferase
LTGKSITFGNFCLIPAPLLSNLVYLTEIWNHFSGGVIRSNIPYTAIPLERGVRLSGKSKMNFISLVLHGMSAVSVHVETVAVRIFISSVILILLVSVGILVVAYIKFFTTYATPGWATSFIFGSLGIIVQALLISLFLIFIVLNHRTQKNFIPILDYKDYVAQIEKISNPTI